MSRPSEGNTATTEPRGFSRAFAQVVLVILLVLVFVCDALPAIKTRLPNQGEIGTGPVASLYHLAEDFFWPGTILLHAGLATLWLACGTWRYSLRLLSVILSMSARAAWVWQLYGLSTPTNLDHYGEPINVCGIPILFSVVIWLTSLGFRGARLKSSSSSSAPARVRLQTIDLFAWTAAIALVLAPALTFFRALKPSIQADRIQYYAPVAMAWIGLTWFSAMLIREWIIDARFAKRLPLWGWILAASLLICGILVVSARLVSEIGPQDMFFNILAYLLPSTIGWCMATGWALRELGVRLEKRQPAARS